MHGNVSEMTLPRFPETLSREELDMVTNFPHTVLPHHAFTTTHERDGSSANGEAVGSIVMDRVRQWLCAAQGHDNLLQFNTGRLCLKCVSCGHETPGWDISKAPPAIKIAGDARRHRLDGPQLVEARRIA